MPESATPISRIVILRLHRNVVGGYATELAESLAELRPGQAAVLDFARVRTIDGYGANVVADALARGVRVYLAGVCGRVRRMFRQAGKVSPSQFTESVEEALRLIEREAEPEPAPPVERRAYPRIRSHIPAEVIIEVDGQRVTTDGVIRDISEGGVYIELLQKLSDILGDELDLNTSIDLRMALPEADYPCFVQGDTVHGGRAANGLCYGVKFKEVSYLDEDAIRIFLFNHDPDRRAGSA